MKSVGIYVTHLNGSPLIDCYTRNFTDLNCKMPLLRIAAVLKQALTQFRNEQIESIREGETHTNYVENIKIILINNNKLLPTFQKVAIPSSGMLCCVDNKVYVGMDPYSSFHISYFNQRIVG